MAQLRGAWGLGLLLGRRSLRTSPRLAE